MIFDAALYESNPIYSRISNRQYAEVNALRTDKNNYGDYNKVFTNAGDRPGQLYLDWDTVTTRQFRLDEGDNILNRLLPLSRPVDIGVVVQGNTRGSDLGKFSTSVSGEHATVFDKVDYDSDKAVIPYSTNGWKTGWRERATLSRENFDDEAVKQEESLRTHRQGVIGHFMDGHKDDDGNFIVEDGTSWKGVRGDTRVDQVDLGAGGLNFDFTDKTKTGAEIYSAFLPLAERRMVTNKITMAADYFTSLEAFWNFQRPWDTSNSSNMKIIDMLRTIEGVEDIMPSSVLSGNQILSMVMNARYIQPLVGQAVSTKAIQRVRDRDPFAFEVCSAIGWQIKNDFGGVNKSIQYAAS